MKENILPTRIYPWGNYLLKAKCNYNRGKKSPSLASVGTYPSGNSVYGCSDMIGNVMEWCSNRYKKISGKKLSSIELRKEELLIVFEIHFL